MLVVSLLVMQSRELAYFGCWGMRLALRICDPHYIYPLEIHLTHNPRHLHYVSMVSPVYNCFILPLQPSVEKKTKPSSPVAKEESTSWDVISAQESEMVVDSSEFPVVSSVANGTNSVSSGEDNKENKMDGLEEGQRTPNKRRGDCHNVTWWTGKGQLLIVVGGCLPVVIRQPRGK